MWLWWWSPDKSISAEEVGLQPFGHWLSDSTAAVPNLFGTRDWFHGRQFFHGRRWGMAQAVMRAMESGRWSFTRSPTTILLLCGPGPLFLQLPGWGTFSSWFYAFVLEIIPEDQTQNPLLSPFQQFCSTKFYYLTFLLKILWCFLFSTQFWHKGPLFPSIILLKKLVTTGVHWNFTAPLLQSRIKETVSWKRGQLCFGTKKPFFNCTCVLTSWSVMYNCQAVIH